MLKRIAIRSIIFAICLYTWSEHARLWADDSIPEFANPAKKYGKQWRFLTIQNFFLHLIVNALFLIGEAFAPGNSTQFNEFWSFCFSEKTGQYTSLWDQFWNHLGCVYRLLAIVFYQPRTYSVKEDWSLLSAVVEYCRAWVNWALCPD